MKNPYLSLKHEWINVISPTNKKYIILPQNEVWSTKKDCLDQKLQHLLHFAYYGSQAHKKHWIWGFHCFISSLVIWLFHFIISNSIQCILLNISVFHQFSHPHVQFLPVSILFQIFAPSSSTSSSVYWLLCQSCKHSIAQDLVLGK